MLEIRGVTKTFHPDTPNEVRSLRGVDLELEPQSWTMIIGTNGSGKSTLLNAVAGTFPVDRGAIRLAGRDITRWSEHARARLIDAAAIRNCAPKSSRCWPRRLTRFWKVRRYPPSGRIVPPVTIEFWRLRPFLYPDEMVRLGARLTPPRGLAERTCSPNCSCRTPWDNPHRKDYRGVLLREKP